jgi:hypothetical protein
MGYSLNYVTDYEKKNNLDSIPEKYLSLIREIVAVGDKKKAAILQFDTLKEFEEFKDILGWITSCRTIGFSYEQKRMNLSLPLTFKGWVTRVLEITKSNEVV